MKREFSRRDFFVSAGKVLATGLLVPISDLALPQMTAAKDGLAGTSWEQLWEGKEWAFVIDTPKCIGCARCTMACKQENGVPLDKEVYRTWVERYIENANGQTIIDSPRGGLEFQQRDETAEKSFFVPKLCNQCRNAPCTQVCPVAATYKTKDGVVLVDRKRCVGCRYCIQACPYGARFLHPVLKVVDKCTWCYHRIVKGMLPACVQVCPTGARNFGNLKDPDSTVTALKKREQTRMLKPDMGTEARVFYIGLDEVVL